LLRRGGGGGGRSGLRGRRPHSAGGALAAGQQHRNKDDQDGVFHDRTLCLFFRDDEHPRRKARSGTVYTRLRDLLQAKGSKLPRALKTTRLVQVEVGRDRLADGMGTGLDRFAPD
jgi:hypothetical protein